MKLDKDNPKHLMLLLVSALLTLAAIPFRVFRSKKQKTVVFFYQMHGNVKALADYIKEHDKSIKMYLMAYPEYLKIYEGKQDLPTLNALSFRDMIKVAQSDAVITNYKAFTLMFLAKLTSIKFVDVFHGILLLKFMPPPILTYLNDYDEVWVSSPGMKKVYIEKFGVRPDKLIPTGYARVDKLINGSYKGVKKKYSIPTNKKIIMIAPTWKHNDPDRNLLPFGMNEGELVTYLEGLAKETNTFFIFRAHMLSGNPLGTGQSSNVRAMPGNEYPDAEELLSMVDILVTDWSSMAFDFMVLDKPVIFVDTKPPFRDHEISHRSNPSARFGEVVKHKEEFDSAVRAYLKNPNSYLQKHAKQIAHIKKQAYGTNADGKATQRCYDRLKALLEG